MKYLHLSWEDIENSCLNIYSKIKQDEYKPDIIIGCMWGGIIPTRLFVDLFDMDREKIKLVYASLYKGIDKRKDEVSIQPFYEKNDILNKNLLVLDDIFDTGKTMKAVLKHLKECCCNVRVATLVVRVPVNTIDYGNQFGADNFPNYFDRIVREEWTKFPWERYEFWREINETKKT